MRLLIVAAMAACMGGTALASEMTKTLADTSVTQAVDTKVWDSARCWICNDPLGNGTKPR